MPGGKNKSYRLSYFIPRAIEDNRQTLKDSYPNIVFKDSAKNNDLQIDQRKLRRQLPPIPNDMDNARIRMSLGNRKPNVYSATEKMRNTFSNPLGNGSTEISLHGYQMTHNPLYNSSTTTLDSESPPAPFRHASSSTDADESSLERISQTMEDMSLGISTSLPASTSQNPLYDADISASVKSHDLPNQFTVVATVESDYQSQKSQLRSSQLRSSQLRSSQLQASQLESSHLDKDSRLFIPEPDYDEDELTIDFKSEDGDGFPSNRNSGTLLYKDYEGEDFGQYLSDEEEHIENDDYNWSNTIKQNYLSMDHSRRARTEVKRQRTTNQRTAQKLFKSAPKMKGNTMRQNLRDFSFADSKISLGNSAAVFYNNRYKKTSDVAPEDEQFLRSRHSYEQFLRNRFPPNVDGGQNWSQRELGTHKHYDKAFGLDFTGRLSRRIRNSKDALIGRLTTRFRRKSDITYEIPEN